VQGVARVGLKGWVGLWGILGSVVALGMKVARGPTTGAHIIPATHAKPINILGLARVFVARVQLAAPSHREYRSSLVGRMGNKQSKLTIRVRLYC